MMTKIKTWLQQNELFCQLFLVVNVFILIVSIATVSVSYLRSKATFLAAYMTSTEQLMDKVHDDYVYLNENINRMMTMLDESQYVKTFLAEGSKNYTNLVGLQNQMKSTRMAFEDIPTNLVLVSNNGATFFQNSGVRNDNFMDFLNQDFIKEIDQKDNRSEYFYVDSGFTTATKNRPGWVAVHKIMDNQKTLGYAVMFINESHLSSIYTKLFNPEVHEIVVVDQNNRVISASNKQFLAHDYQAPKQQPYVVEKHLYATNFKFINVIDSSKLIQSINLIQPVILIVAITILLVSILAFIYIRRTTRPIYHLIEKLPAVKEGDFTQKVTPEGTYEIRELGMAYNTMLDELEQYFERLLVTEKEKRLTEIRSLQMQIKPHFIYNTLASIKFLIWQKDNQTAAEAIDDFIVLLRHTLREANEIIPLSEELAGVKAYTKILNLRYGENIQTTFFSSDEADQAFLPKMLIQPIIENAYLHAFPDQREGFIQVFARVNNKEQQLQIEIMDNGVGFDQSQKQVEQKQKQPVDSHYSGIGLNNINERVRLLYGTDFGLEIVSTPGGGTQITLRLPLIKEAPQSKEV